MSSRARRTTATGAKATPTSSTPPRSPRSCSGPASRRRSSRRVCSTTCSRTPGPLPGSFASDSNGGRGPRRIGHGERGDRELRAPEGGPSRAGRRGRRRLGGDLRRGQARPGAGPPARGPDPGRKKARSLPGDAAAAPRAPSRGAAPRRARRGARGTGRREPRAHGQVARRRHDRHPADRARRRRPARPRVRAAQRGIAPAALPGHAASARRGGSPIPDGRRWEAPRRAHRARPRHRRPGRRGALRARAGTPGRRGGGRGRPRRLAGPRSRDAPAHGAHQPRPRARPRALQGARRGRQPGRARALAKLGGEPTPTSDGLLELEFDLPAAGLSERLVGALRAAAGGQLRLAGRIAGRVARLVPAGSAPEG